MKKCSRCKIVKPKSEFWKDKSRKDGFCRQCKACMRERFRANDYGIDNGWYNKKFNEQQGCCAVCGIHQSELKRGFDIDHNHFTNQVRGLLCTNCNNGIGRFKENIQTLEKAIKYLEYYNKLAQEV